MLLDECWGLVRGGCDVVGDELLGLLVHGYLLDEDFGA